MSNVVKNVRNAELSGPRDQEESHVYFFTGTCGGPGFFLRPDDIIPRFQMELLLKYVLWFLDAFSKGRNK